MHQMQFTAPKAAKMIGYSVSGLNAITDRGEIQYMLAGYRKRRYTAGQIVEFCKNKNLSLHYENEKELKILDSVVDKKREVPRVKCYTGPDIKVCDFSIQEMGEMFGVAHASVHHWIAKKDLRMHYNRRKQRRVHGVSIMRFKKSQNLEFKILEPFKQRLLDSIEEGHREWEKLNRGNREAVS